MDHTEKTLALRADEQVHHNCAQAILVAWAQELGLPPDGAYRLGAHFGSGMRHGSTCGAVSAALMVLGALGYDEKAAGAMLRQFRDDHGALDCATLLSQAKEQGQPRKEHCDGLVLEMTRVLDALNGG